MRRTARKSRFHLGVRIAGALAIVVVAVALAPSFLSARPAFADALAKPATSAATDPGALAVAQQLSTAFENVADLVAPSVVSIRTAREVTVQQMQVPEQFRRFFQDPFFGGGRQRLQPQHQYQKAQGSGFVVSEDGYIVTNNHVIDHADDISISFTDGRTYSAKLVGADPKTDIAILKVDADDLTPLKLGDSDELRVGQFVVAVGTPFGLSSTITTGVVSAKGRSRVGLSDYEDFIQTDAAINPGNSGGPLVNLRGEVIGVNSAIVSRSGGNNGIGFAIPINMVKSVQDELIANGHVTRGFLGVRIQDLTPDMARSFDYDGTAGALVGEVEPDTPASDAGLKPGDIITSLDGKPVANSTDLRFHVAAIKPGSRVDLSIYRSGRERTVTVKIGQLPSSEETASVKSTTHTLADQIGAKLSTLTPELAGQVGLSDSTRGVLVERVEPIGAAAKAGLQAGDVIVAAQGEPVDSLSELRMTLDDLDLDKGVRLTVRTRAGSRFVYLSTHS